MAKVKSIPSCELKYFVPFEFPYNFLYKIAVWWEVKETGFRFSTKLLLLPLFHLTDILVQRIAKNKLTPWLAISKDCNHGDLKLSFQAISDNYPFGAKARAFLYKQNNFLLLFRSPSLATMSSYRRSGIF